MRTGAIRLLTVLFWFAALAVEAEPVFHEVALHWFGSEWGIVPAIWCVAALSVWLWSIASCLAEIVVLWGERAALRTAMRRLQ